jgi:Protein of unknown function (DUF2892)
MVRAGTGGSIVASATNFRGEEVAMTRNMGTTDRAIRAFGVAPAAIVVAFLVGAGTAAGVILFAVAGIMWATSATGFCPNYVLIGISTDPHLHRVGHHLRGGHA